MGKCVLIVDDEEDVRAIAKIGLEMAADWTVLTVNSGREGLKIAQTHQPDVILLDLMMPDWDGRETLKQLKANPATQGIPVILMTAKTQTNIEDLDLRAVITKPFRPLQLPEQIAKVLEN